MNHWKHYLHVDPIPALLNSGRSEITYFVRRDLQDDQTESARTLWKLPVVEKIFNKQASNGSWKYHGGKNHIRAPHNYDQLETYRILGELIEKYGLTRAHPAIPLAAEFLFGFQTDEGDFRGIYGDQYSPNYSAAIMELLIKAGYADDARITRGFRWLLSVRQDDGGWAIPLRTVGAKYPGSIRTGADCIAPDRSKPFSHLITGVVLRAFAAHPHYRSTDAAAHAGALFTSRFFKADVYSDRKAPSYWTKFSFPFWFTDLLSSLDSLSLLGFPIDNPNIVKAFDWFRSEQDGDGLWRLSLLRTKDKALNEWVSLAVCRVVKRSHHGVPTVSNG
jgi:hypothetical protein